MKVEYVKLLKTIPWFKKWLQTYDIKQYSCTDSENFVCFVWNNNMSMEVSFEDLKKYKSWFYIWYNNL